MPFRTIDTEIWNNAWFYDLSPAQKTIYIFLFSNPYVSNIGVMEISRKQLAAVTGVSVPWANRFLEELESMGQLVTDGRHILLVKFIAKQTHFGADTTAAKNDNLRKNLVQLFENCPSQKFKEVLQRTYPHLFNLNQNGFRNPEKSDSVETAPSRQMVTPFTQDTQTLASPLSSNNEGATQAPCKPLTSDDEGATEGGREGARVGGGGRYIENKENILESIRSISITGTGDAALSIPHSLEEKIPSPHDDAAWMDDIPFSPEPPAPQSEPGSPIRNDGTWDEKVPIPFTPHVQEQKDAPPDVGEDETAKARAAEAQRQLREIEEAFSKWWSLYPRKVGKKAALKKWVKLAKSGTLPAMTILLDALSWQVTLPQWQDIQFVPHPETYLNQQRWQDEPPPRQQPRRPQQGPYQSRNGKLTGKDLEDANKQALYNVLSRQAAREGQPFPPSFDNMNQPEPLPFEALPYTREPLP